MIQIEPEATIREYAKAFGTLQPGAVVPYYALPCTFISPHGTIVAPDSDGAWAMAHDLMENAAKQGYVSSQLVDVQTTRLAEGLAMVRGVFVRCDQAQLELMRFGFIYLLRRIDSQWKIVVAVAHDPPTAV